MSIIIFDTLYGIDKSNKVKEWKIMVENLEDYSVITYTYGYINCKKVECKLTINSGKNIGKKNQTTHYEQAISNAKSKWKKKQETEGYKSDLEELKKSIQNQSPDKIILPMLAQDYKKQKAKVKFPCYIQPKLDGYRMIYNHKTKTVTTRTGKSYGVLFGSSLYNELLQIQHTLDGELYVHDSDFKFEYYGVLRKQKLLKEEEKDLLNTISFYVYDIVDENVPFSERLLLLEKMFNGNPFYKIKTIPTMLCETSEQIDYYHKLFINDGYEGSIIRNASGLYKCKFRSADLLKNKDFDDSEFKIVNFASETDTTGNNNNLIIWVCETESGHHFNVQSKGTREERQILYKTANDYIGKKLWVQYFGLTNDGIPRFPKTMRNGRESIRNNII